MSEFGAIFMRALTIFAAFAALAMTGCAPDPELRVDDAYVRLAATPKNPAAGYFTVVGGPKTDRLLSVSSPVVIRAEMHESMAGQSGMMSMKPIEGGIEIPAGRAIEFKPGGRHVMLYNVNPGIVPPRTLQMIFTFASGERITVDAQVKRAGDE
jgi:periplasmic copper chaperone A